MARDVGFDGIKGGSYVTFKSTLVKGTDEGKLVKISAAGTVVLCAAEDENFIGIVRIIDAKDKAASVQIDGFVTFAVDPAHPFTVTTGQGWQAIQSGVTPATAVKAATAAATIPLRLVVSLDGTSTVTFKL